MMPEAISNAEAAVRALRCRLFGHECGVTPNYDKLWWGGCSYDYFCRRCNTTDEFPDGRDAAFRAQVWCKRTLRRALTRAEGQGR